MSSSDLVAPAIPETTTAAESARVQLIPVPIASPGACAMCGKSEHPKGFADPNLMFEFYGSFYICGDCVSDFANLFGYISPEQAIMLARRVAYLEEQLQIHRDALLALESSVDNLTNYRMLRSVITDPDADASVSGATDEASEINNEAAGGTVIELSTRVNETESVLNESASQQGPNDVPSNSGDEQQPIIPL